MRQPSNQPRCRGAFSLVELLVVIGIIALLVGILLPTISSARRAAQQTRCIATLRALGQAFQLFAGDHVGHLPLGGGIAADDPWAHPEGLNDSRQRKYAYISNDGNGMNIVPNAIPGALSSYLIGRQTRTDHWQTAHQDITERPILDHFTCAADDATADRSYGPLLWINNQQGNYLTGYSSYGFNSEVFGWQTWRARARGRLTVIRRPSETMLMCDASYAGGTWELWVEQDEASLAYVYLGPASVGYRSFDLQRHRGKINILYADWHVDSRPILRTGASVAEGPLGSPGNSPSGVDGLEGVSMNRGFKR